MRQTRTGRAKALARGLGFARVAVAAAAPPPRREAFAAAMAAGYHGEMAWLARPESVAKRGDPNLVLPGARAIVCVALGYYPGPEPPTEGHRLVGRIARYARGDDYHDTLTPRLEELAEALRAEGGEARVYVDTGPIQEVSHAARAGLGWIGKHSLLLDRRGGSWFLLGEVLTTLELEPDPPVPDGCGSCRRCLDACPSEAFPAPYVVDARRCLSYLTIELKGPIPRELRPRMGTWIFGCDVCQEVCPWSQRFAAPTDEPAFAARPGLSAPDLIELLALDDEGFRARFRGSPIRRTKRRGLLRNVCVALGNLGDGRAVPALAHALSDAEPLVRAHAAWALGRLGGGEAVAALRRAMGGEPEPGVRDELVAALAEAVAD